MLSANVPKGDVRFRRAKNAGLAVAAPEDSHHASRYARAKVCVDVGNPLALYWPRTNRKVAKQRDEHARGSAGEEEESAPMVHGARAARMG